MAQFTLTWDNTDVLANDNVLTQAVYYRQKSVGGAYIDTGFTPDNPLATSVTSTVSPTLDDNVVYQFKIAALCDVNGPSYNDNGVREAIQFACITPTITPGLTVSGITSNASIDVTGLDITKARFTLRKSSDDSIVLAPVIVNKVGTTINKTATALLPDTDYYWQIELYATVNGVLVKSSDIAYIGSVCDGYSFTTDPITVCEPVTAVTVTSYGY